MTLLPASISLSQGETTSVEVAIAGHGGFSDSVVLAANGMPSGASLSFAPALAPVGGSATAIVQAGNAVAGNYAVNFVGASGSLQHTTTLQLAIHPSTAASGCNQVGAGGWLWMAGLLILLMRRRRKLGAVAAQGTPSGAARGVV
jgi:MYXO-CTERM domain-containing protein